MIFLLGAMAVCPGIVAGNPDKPLKITVVPWGPTEKDAAEAKRRAEESPAVRSVLSGTKYRLMALEYIDPHNSKRPPSRYRITFYDYTNNRTFLAEGDFAGKESVTVRQADFQPGVSDDELQAAYATAASDTEFGPAYRGKRVEFMAAMPPVSEVGGERYVNVGVRDTETGSYRVVGVNLGRNQVRRYEGGAPRTSKAAESTCGVPSAQQETTINGTPGQAMLTISDASGPLWEMLVLRPSISSGKVTERSGIEVRDLKYRGKLVMKRGHAPVLNVKYTGDFCGPFRDWQYQEGMFNAPDDGANDAAPGIRVLADGKTATTVLDTGNDAGNFRGVAVYRQTTAFGQEVVLISEMEAGWYRYMAEWRFAADGTIRPRYGFGAVEDSCTCAVHMHHAYWRFDFDVVDPINKVFQVERGGKFMLPIRTEAKIARNYATNRTLVVQNASGDEAVALVPNLTDGVADTFAAGDLWVLRFQGTADLPGEIDDPGTTEQINIDPWVNGESVDGQNVVVWYGATFAHNDGADRLNPSRSPEILTGSHVIGPDIRLIRW